MRCASPPYKSIEGLEHIDKVIDIDQSPIGRTPRSNPVTYTKVFDEIRSLFASLPEAQIRGYKPGRFSFNVAEYCFIFTVLSFEENGVYFVFFSMRFERIPFFILNSTKAYR